MDLYNNEVGRQVAMANPAASPEELAGLVDQVVRDGDTVITDWGGELAYSNDVPQGGPVRAMIRPPRIPALPPVRRPAADRTPAAP